MCQDTVRVCFSHVGPFKSMYLTADRKQSIKNDCHMLLGTRHPEIRDVARVLGKITSSLPGVMMGRLHYRCLDMNKTEALKNARGNYNKRMILSDDAKNDLTWWHDNVENSFNVVDRGKPNFLSL